jgi:hypothetical protein
VEQKEIEPSTSALRKRFEICEEGKSALQPRQTKNIGGCNQVADATWTHRLLAIALPPARLDVT